MEYASKRLTLFIIIFLSVITSVSNADEFVNNASYVNENKYLDVVDKKQLDSSLEDSSIKDDFLLSHKIAQNQIIGVNYGEQDINNKLGAKQKSKLWLSLQLAF